MQDCLRRDDSASVKQRVSVLELPTVFCEFATIEQLVGGDECLPCLLRDLFAFAMCRGIAPLRRRKPHAAAITAPTHRNVALPILAGEFTMGLPHSDKDALDSEKAQHRVRITRPPSSLSAGSIDATDGWFWPELTRFEGWLIPPLCHVDVRSLESRTGTSGRGARGSSAPFLDTPCKWWQNGGKRRSTYHPGRTVRRQWAS